MIQNNQSYRGGKINQPKQSLQLRQRIHPKDHHGNDDGKELVEFSRRMGEKFVKMD